MINITNAGERMLKNGYGGKDVKGFRIEAEKPACSACRYELRLEPGVPEDNDEILYASDYVFYVDKDLLGMAESITVDAAGDIPILFPRNSIDPLEHV